MSSMPTYVYECSKCTKVFEVEQRIVEDAWTTCQCGQDGSVKRVVQPTAIMFKGSGFYVNDSVSRPVESATESKTDAASSDTSESVKSEEANPSEAKPAEPTTPSTTPE